MTADLTVKVGDYGIGPYRFKVSRQDPRSLHAPSNKLTLDVTSALAAQLPADAVTAVKKGS